MNASARHPNALSVLQRISVIVGISTLLVMGLGACDSSTTQQDPDASPAIPLPETVTATRETKAVTSWTMPDLVGSELQSAQNQIQSLTDFAITVTTSHDAAGAGRQQVVDANWRVCSQNIPPGATIDSGTRIDFGAVKLEERCP
ncbi:MAG: PASTA domain-containing protein [Actinomycetota bacterium]|nr:PASTA domain-containing protein [Actinomycetota bacterium]